MIWKAFLPDYFFDRVWDITEEDISAIGVKLFLLDLDNTLSEHNGKVPCVEAVEWLQKLNGLGVDAVIVSNNTASRVKAFADLLNLSYVCKAHKPFPGGFKAVIRRFGYSCAEVAVVGDQIYTDVLGGNLSKLKTILVRPIKPESGLFLWLKRLLEEPVLHKIKTMRRE
ncbi:MAG: YqeG family HAD IIIA-type phosphatase [Oscillospiraceae bacterium]|nr:YqeG family HAD IIIA-type phosphatase [Oscillospiraceae bacterium]